MKIDESDIFDAKKYFELNADEKKEIEYIFNKSVSGFENYVKDAKFFSQGIIFRFEIIDRGNVWKDFKGGAPVERQSHWWVKVKPLS